jgi:hypothetical protein
MRGYTNGLISGRLTMPAGAEHVHLPPGGWLTGVIVRKLDHARADLRFELTDCNLVPLYADLTVPVDLTEHGVWFEPVPNLNSAHPYVLRCPAGCPPIEILTINRENDWSRS